MTAAKRPHIRFRDRALPVLGVVLPVPVLAATGLSLPMPSTVERLAARLVPFADASVVGAKQAFMPGKKGSIRLAEGEARSRTGREEADSASARVPNTGRQRGAGPAANRTDGETAHAGRKPKPSDDSSAQARTDDGVPASPSSEPLRAGAPSTGQNSSPPPPPPGTAQPPAPSPPPPPPSPSPSPPPPPPLQSPVDTKPVENTANRVLDDAKKVLTPPPLPPPPAVPTVPKIG